MPALQDIRKGIEDTLPPHEAKRRECLASLYEYTGRDTIIYASAFTDPGKKGTPMPPHALSLELGDVQGFMASLHGLVGDKLDLIVHSPGGSLEATEQIVLYLREKYEHIRVVVPLAAMSAATMLACAADEVVMGKHSALGPIDPQITFTDSHGGQHRAPAQSLMDEVDDCIAGLQNNPPAAPYYLQRMERYPAGFVNLCRTTMQLAEDKAAHWLKSYMFRGDEDADDKAKELAAWLADAAEHKTHGRPLGIKELRERGMKVVALEDDAELQEQALSVFHCTMIHFERTACVKLIENHQGRYMSLVLTPPKG